MAVSEKAAITSAYSTAVRSSHKSDSRRPKTRPPNSPTCSKSITTSSSCVTVIETAKDSDLKPRVERIREEVKKIDDAHIWITEAKEIENYLPGSVLAEATDLSPLPDPKKYESWSSYTAKNMDGKRIDKVDLAISSTPSMTSKKLDAKGRFDWKEQMKQIVERIDSWNGNS